MDPNECLKRWRAAYAAGNQYAEAREAKANLADWLNQGGFFPSLMTEDEVWTMRKMGAPRPSADYIYG